MKPMKKVLAILTSLASLSLVALTSCSEEVESGYEGTLLSVTSWPDNVERVSLHAESSRWTLNKEEAGSCMASEYFSGKATLTIYFPRLDDGEYADYIGYGSRGNAAAPFRVFINDQEAENERELAQTLESTQADSDSIDLNAQIDYFITSFDISGLKTVEVTFENQPEKIAWKDLRLSDETIYAYIDPSDLLERFQNLSFWDYDNWTQLPRIGRSGLYFINRYTPHFYVYISPRDNYYISATDFALNVAGTAAPTDSAHNSSTFCEVKAAFSASSAPYVAAGEIIAVTGGSISAYDVTHFAGKNLTFADSVRYTNCDSVTEASLSLQDGESGRTFSLQVNGERYSGSWKADSCAFGDGRIVAKTLVSSSQSHHYADFELTYFASGYNGVPGPCWLLEAPYSHYAPDSEYEYASRFILTEAE